MSAEVEAHQVLQARGWNQQLGRWGEQPGEQTWAIGDAKQLTIASARATPYLWRVSAIGENVILSLRYGTYATIELDQLSAPLIADVPGTVSVLARPRNPAAVAFVRATLTEVRSGNTLPRTIWTTPGALPSAARRVTALSNPASVTVRGVVVSLTPGQSIDVFEQSVLNAGAIAVEFAI